MVRTQHPAQSSSLLQQHKTSRQEYHQMQDYEATFADSLEENWELKIFKAGPHRPCFFCDQIRNMSLRPRPFQVWKNVWWQCGGKEAPAEINRIGMALWLPGRHCFKRRNRRLLPDSFQKEKVVIIPGLKHPQAQIKRLMFKRFICRSMISDFIKLSSHLS